MNELHSQDIERLLSAMTQDIYQRLMTAVELGKWSDGVSLTEKQKAECLQMIMLWQSRYNHQPEHMTIGTDGKIAVKSKQELKREFHGDEVARLTPKS